MTFSALSTTPGVSAGTGAQAARHAASHLPSTMRGFLAVLSGLTGDVPEPTGVADPSADLVAQPAAVAADHAGPDRPVHKGKEPLPEDAQAIQQPASVLTASVATASVASASVLTASVASPLSGATTNVPGLQADDSDGESATGATGNATTGMQAAEGGSAAASNLRPLPFSTMPMGSTADATPGVHPKARSALAGDSTALPPTLQASQGQAEGPDEDKGSAQPVAPGTGGRVSSSARPEAGTAAKAQAGLRSGSERPSPGLGTLLASAVMPDAAVSKPVHTSATAPLQDLGSASQAAPLAAPVATPSASGMSAAPSGTPAPLPVSEQLGQACMGLQFSAAAGGHVSIRLNPAELGHVTVDLTRSANGGSIVNLTVERAETLRNLQASIVYLHQSLDRAGIPAEHRTVTVSLAAPDAGGSQSQGSTSGQHHKMPGNRPERGIHRPARLRSLQRACHGRRQSGTRRSLVAAFRLRHHGLTSRIGT